MLKQRLKEQINDIRDPLLYLAYQSEGHAIERHVLNDDELRRALWVRPMPKNIDEIDMVTRFRDKEQALNLIADTLLQNIDTIEKWLLTDTEDAYEATASFADPTGDGLAKRTDWSKTIPVHGVRVILAKNFQIVGRSFVVVTAYPQRTFEDIDAIYDAIDDYLAKKNQ